jgi:hypothetical protein
MVKIPYVQPQKQSRWLANVRFFLIGRRMLAGEKHMPGEQRDNAPGSLFNASPFCPHKTVTSPALLPLSST